MTWPNEISGHFEKGNPMTTPGSSAALAQVDADADPAQLYGVPQRITAAWAEHDADAFASVFTEDGVLILPGDILLRSRSEIRSFMAAGFAGPYRGTQVFGLPLDAKILAPGVGVVITEGGVLAPGETAVSPERTIRATWVLVKRGDNWYLASYQNGPKNGT
jgi:uncharacterized protein (TIGR02246 family)